MNVLIAGSGPVAFLAGLSAKRAGFAPQVLGNFSNFEDLPDAFEPRVVALSPASVSQLQSLGAWAHIDAARCAPMQAMKVWASAFEKPLIIDALQLRASALATIVEHGNLMRALHRTAREQGIVLHEGRVESVRSESSEVVVRTSRETHVGAALLIANPSVRSYIAELARALRTTAYAHKALVFNIQLTLGHGGVAFQQFAPNVSPHSVVALLPLPRNFATVVWSLADAEAERLQALSDAALAEALGAAFSHPFGEITVMGARNTVPLLLNQTRLWHHARCVVLGDAAHTLHPLAGQGLNLGIADVAAIADAWKHSRDPGHPLVLGRYARARATATAQTQFVTDGLWRSVAGNWQEATSVRNVAFTLSRHVPALQRLFAGHAMNGQ